MALFLTGCFAVPAAQTLQKDSETEKARLAMCDAAGPKLHEAGTNQIVLMLTLNAKGQVGSFKTESPKGLKLEKMPEVATKGDTFCTSQKRWLASCGAGQDRFRLYPPANQHPLIVETSPFHSLTNLGSLTGLCEVYDHSSGHGSQEKRKPELGKAARFCSGCGN